MLAVDFGGKLSSEEKMLLAADLAMFTRVCKELELTPGRLQKRNLAVFERARALLAEDVPAVPVPASPKE